MARAPVLAAGGIVLRQAKSPLIAVVRLRKRNEWVLPKGKLDDGETARDAAEREVNEETGHDVIVHEFLGTLVYESGGRSKVVHYWRMQADGDQVYDLMSDIREVDWLQLDAAVERLSRSYERAFLENVGPIAVEAAVADLRKARATPAKKRRARPVAPAQPPLAEPVPVEPVVLEAPVESEVVDGVALLDAEQPFMLDEAQDAAPVEKPMQSVDPVETSSIRTESDLPPSVESCEALDDLAAPTLKTRRKTLAEKLRDWLRRAA
jgi:8-oxo-dGTP diphosphatase